MENKPTTPQDNGCTMNDEIRIEILTEKFYEVLNLLGVDLKKSGMADTPKRMAKLYFNELLCGLKHDSKPRIMVQDNDFNYDQMVIESNIMINSICEHHFVPIIGHCHVAYIPNNKVIGLSKINRLCDYNARQPQVQERMTEQIKKTLQTCLETEDVAVTIDAIHMCVRMRGIKDYNSNTRTSALGGAFLKEARMEYFNAIPRISDLKI